MIRTAPALVLLLLLTGCVAMPKYVALSPETKSGLGEVRATSFVVQDEIIVVAQPSGVAAAVGGGLIAALIDSSIAKGRQAEIQSRIEPFYDAVDDFDFRREFWITLVPYLQRSYPVKVADVKTAMMAMTRVDHDKVLAGLPAGKGFMLIGTGYRFTPDYTRLTMLTGVDIWSGGRKEAPQEPVYSNLFVYQSAPLAAADGDPLQQWGANAGRLYRERVKEGIAETVRMFALDMEHPRFSDRQNDAGAKAITVRQVNDFGATLEVTGSVLYEDASRVTVRNSDGRLLSLPR